MKIFTRLRELAYVVKAWFTQSEVLYERQLKRVYTPDGHSTKVVQMLPKFMVKVPEVTTKSAKFMTDLRLIGKIDKKYWANPDVSAYQLASFSNNDIGVESIGDDEDIELGEFSAEEASAEAAAVMRQHVSSIKAQKVKRGDAPKKLTTHLYQPELSPADVFAELSTTPAKADMTNLDAKIDTMERSLGLIRIERARGNSSTTKDILERLRNRRVYRDTTPENRAFFDQYKCTIDEHIVTLLEKYQHLKIGPVDDFLPEMPPDAQKSMLDYLDKCVEMFRAKPVFYIIAKQDDFAATQQARQKRDPILLVQSPFGLYWQIIGVWDMDHMVALDEI